MVGVNTVLADNPHLKANSRKKCLRKIILDSSLRTPLKARLFSGVPPSDCTIAVTAKASQRQKFLFMKKGINILVCPQHRGQIDLKWLFKELAKREITSILIEGGAHIIGSALREKLIDKMYIYIAPKIMGDQKALSSIVGLQTAKIGQVTRLQKIKVNKINEDILVTGYV
jgi:diaminohydroxyphosphoribosylaminopyrimidine deaminase/5-amino-6-(5-phosphoribosylamino)uracil reductase